MTPYPLAAVCMAAALLVAPNRPRRRLPAFTSAVHAGHRPRTASGVLAVVSVAAVMAVAPPSVTFVGIAAATGLVAWQRRRRSDRRRRREGRLVADALEILIGELQVGAHPVRAFATAAAESADPVAAALRAVAARARLGADVGAGLRTVASDSSVPAYWTRLAVLWELAIRQGLPMAVLMRAAHRDIVDRQRFADRIRAALAGARATSVILALLPFLGVLLGQLIGAHPIRFLFGGGVGGFLLVLGVSLIAAGLFWADHIIGRLAG